jgi:hypothetical protein
MHQTDCSTTHNSCCAQTSPDGLGVDGKVLPVFNQPARHEDVRNVDVKLHVFLAWALTGDKWRASRSSPFTALKGASVTVGTQLIEPHSRSAHSYK